MKISVVIPVLNEERWIGNCLQALEDNDEKAYEIIVVDGGSTDKTVKIAQDYGAKVFENLKGHAAGGRNVGIRNAHGDIIAFTDGDCIVAKDWIRNIRVAFEKKTVDGIGGLVEPMESENKYENFWGNLWLKRIMTFTNEPYRVTKRSLNDAFITANCAYKRQLLLKLKGFSNWFANNAEDVDLAWRAFDTGAVLWYEPDVRVQAHSPLDMKGIRRKSFRNGYSSSKLQKKYGKFINYDLSLYKMLLISLLQCIKGDIEAFWMVQELVWHLAGKYYGSVKTGVINI